MINFLSYAGVNLHSEVCFWTILGLIRTIFDATLFKVNANLKQVWQMGMPPELSMPLQRALRTMISGVMLVQCFTVYVYLASYIVLMYPVFLEERPTLVLPWLLLAAIRKFLCELTSLALGLGTCVLVGPARPACVKFVISKIISITPAFYMWMLVYSYYTNLKVATAFKTFPAVLSSNDHDYGLELAVRRRRTKSLLGEDQLRKKLTATIFNQEPRIDTNLIPRPQVVTTFQSKLTTTNQTDAEDKKETEELISKSDYKTDIDISPHLLISERLLSNLGTYEDWCGSEITVPRDTDRILEQFVLMLLRISAYLKAGGSDPVNLFSATSSYKTPYSNIECTTLTSEDTETPPQVGNSKPRTTSYVQEYPQIFMKKACDSMQRASEQILGNSRTICNQIDNDHNATVTALVENRSLQIDGSNFKQFISMRTPVVDETKLFMHNLKLSVKDNEIRVKHGKDIETQSITSLPSADDLTGVTLNQENKTQAEPSVVNKQQQNLANIELKEESIELTPKESEVNIHAIDNNRADIVNDVEKTESNDSIQNIIDRMRASLSDKEKSDTLSPSPTCSHRSRSREISNNRSRQNSRTNAASKKGKDKGLRSNKRR